MLGGLRILTALVILALIGGGVFLWFTAPARLDPVLRAELAAASPNAARGEQVFLAAGCGSCHSAPQASGAAKRVLSGGQSFPSDFGTFVAPNISPDPAMASATGRWSNSPAP